MLSSIIFSFEENRTALKQSQWRGKISTKLRYSVPDSLTTQQQVKVVSTQKWNHGNIIKSSWLYSDKHFKAALLGLLPLLPFIVSRHLFPILDQQLRRAPWQNNLKKKKKKKHFSICCRLSFRQNCSLFWLTSKNLVPDLKKRKKKGGEGWRGGYKRIRAK